MIRHFPLPPSGGIGLKPGHYAPMLAACRGEGGVPPGWVEVHPQNYFCAGGPPHRWLETVADVRPLSFHSTGLSLGSPDGPDLCELEQLCRLVERYAPAMVSDHLSWSNGDGEKFPDLLPVPYTREALALFSANVAQVQDRLKRAILIENPSRYLAFAADSWAETEFIHELCRRAGCGLLLDINNVDVSATNLGFSAESWLAAIDPALVGEIHLAGHATERHADGTILKIDDHGSPVSARCWALYRDFLARSGPLPTLIERDTNVPSYDELMAEATGADAVLAVSEGDHVRAA
jgi:uncharacterized protein